MIKWSVHSEKGRFTRETAGKHKIIFKFIENDPNYQSVEVVERYETSGKMAKFCYFAISDSLTVFGDTFAVLALAFSLLNSRV